MIGNFIVFSHIGATAHVCLCAAPERANWYIVTFRCKEFEGFLPNQAAGAALPLTRSSCSANSASEHGMPM